MLAAIPAVSADLIGDITSGITKIIPVPLPVTNEAAPIVDTAIVPVQRDSPYKVVQLPPSKRANYEYKEQVDMVGQFWAALITGKQNIYPVDVYLNGNRVAVIASDSPFVNRAIHEYCLQYQYGTENWYNCEVQYP
jgi:hypothetical protein